MCFFIYFDYLVLNPIFIFFLVIKDFFFDKNCDYYILVLLSLFFACGRLLLYMYILFLQLQEQPPTFIIHFSNHKTLLAAVYLFFASTSSCFYSRKSFLQARAPLLTLFKSKWWKFNNKFLPSCL